MASGARGTRDKEMAAHLRSRGIFHGRRLTAGHCPICYHANHGGPCTAVGSTKFERYMASRRSNKTQTAA